MRSTRHSGERGQALIITVLVLLVAAALGALFVAIISFNLAQVAREAEVLELREIAEAGIRYADSQLTNSPEGADWRPLIPFGQSYGRGAFDLEIVYSPNDSDPTSRFIKIVSTSYFPQETRTGSPFLKHRLVAFKPILLTDYARFVTDRFNSGEPASLSVPEIDRNGVQLPYVTQVRGPVRVNTDLIWYGTSWIYQTTDADRIEVSGAEQMAHAVAPGGSQVLLFDRYNNLIPTSTAFAMYLRTDDVPKAAPPLIDAADPVTGTSRYLALTRDSGRWFQVNSGWFNTGQLAFALDNRGNLLYNGLYIENANDIQFGHSYDQLRSEWLSPPMPPASPGNWDQVRKVYTPPGVEIILHPETYPLEGPYTALRGLPYLELIRHDKDASGQPVAWRMGRQDSTDVWALRPVDDWLYDVGLPKMSELPTQPPQADPRGQRLLLPYPRNGVICAEGNLRVWGTLPVSATVGRYYESDAARRFDLTIVSGGTIYIDGPIRTPLRAGLTTDPNADSHIALLARDNVCLNTTQSATGRFRLSPDADSAELLLSPQTGTYVDNSNLYYKLPGGSFSFPFTYNDRGILRSATTRAKFFLRHAAFTGSDEAPAADTSLAASLGLYNYSNFNPLTPQWWNGTSYNAPAFTFKPHEPPVTDPFSPVPDPATSYCWYQLRSDGPFQLPVAGPPAVDLLADPNLFGPGLDNVLTFSVTPSPNSTYSYVLADAMVNPLKFKPGTTTGEPADPALLEVDALIYAQNGSWFILPGPWANEDSSDHGDSSDTFVAPPSQLDEDFPWYHEPLNMRIVILGAISENRPAPVGDTRDWTSKWSGPGAGRWDGGHPTSVLPFSATKGPYLSYEYDSDLRKVVYQNDAGAPLPRLPKLPVSPGLILWGERI